ncbi:TPA: hypothetical protein NO555_001808 [Klebsiella variicola subsp. variicola]|nr:hypothetical protein [Klebsiella variicola subsp. variicola]HCI4623555.1 hypothetical protein [Klebsiella variicola subsp. variicola]HCI6657767.1 hypothetical protein [Klebsiella variicola subsp. variicola]
MFADLSLECRALTLEMARKEGIEMNGQDRLLTRTCIAASVAAKDRYRQRMIGPDFQWKSPLRRADELA